MKNARRRGRERMLRRVRKAVGGGEARRSMAQRRFM